MLKMNYVMVDENFLNCKYSKKELRQQIRKQGRPLEEFSYYKKTYSGLCFTIFNDRNDCYISTKEGVIIKVKFFFKINND
mgnify:FL=1